MSGIQVFSYNDNDIRTVEQEGVVWWVLTDICKVLGLSTPSRVAERLEDDEVSQTHIIDSLGRTQEVTTVNESGLYNVILRSDKPEAVPFRRWVTHEVLPSIRKHGAYMTPETLEKAILNPDTLIQIATALKAEQDKNKALQAANAELTVQVQIDRPKVEYFDTLCERGTLTNFRETAKQLGIPQKKFVQFLLDRKYVYRDQRGKLMPYAQYIDKGLFAIKESFNENTQWSGTQTLVTVKGRETFSQLYLTA